MKKSPLITLKTPITINSNVITGVIIGQHYKVNHAESINDEIVLQLILALDERPSLQTLRLRELNTMYQTFNYKMKKNKKVISVNDLTKDDFEEIMENAPVKKNCTNCTKPFLHRTKN